MADPPRDNELHTLLREEKRRMWTELREEVFRTLGDDVGNQFDVPLDNAERSFVDLFADAGLTLAEVRQEELAKMEEAERKLEQGTYGLCEECGEEIPADRLKIVPYALYCVPCQEKREGVTYPPPGSQTI